MGIRLIKVHEILGQYRAVWEHQHFAITSDDAGGSKGAVKHGSNGTAVPQLHGVALTEDARRLQPVARKHIAKRGLHGQSNNEYRCATDGKNRRAHGQGGGKVHFVNHHAGNQHDDDPQRGALETQQRLVIARHTPRIQAAHKESSEY